MNRIAYTQARIQQCRHLIAGGARLAQIADVLGISPSGACHFMKRHGIERPVERGTGIAESDIPELRRMIEGGARQVDAGKRFGVSATTICLMCQKHGIEQVKPEVIRFDDAQLAVVREMAADGATMVAIAQRLDVTPAIVLREMRANGIEQGAVVRRARAKERDRIAHEKHRREVAERREARALARERQKAERQRKKDELVLAMLAERRNGLSNRQIARRFNMKQASVGNLLRGYDDGQAAARVVRRSEPERVMATARFGGRALTYAMPCAPQVAGPFAPKAERTHSRAEWSLAAQMAAVARAEMNRCRDTLFDMDDVA